MSASAAGLAVAWLAVLLCTPLAIGNRRWPLLTGLWFSAAFITFQAPVTYRIIDPVLGGVGATDLLYRICNVAAVGAFAVMIGRSSGSRPLSSARLVGAVTVAGCAGEAVLFTVAAATHRPVDPGTTTASPFYVGYGAITWIAQALLGVLTAVVVLRQTRGTPWSVVRVGITAVGAGGLVSAVWGVRALVDAALLAQAGQREPASDALAQGLITVTIALVLGGLLVVAAPGLFERFSLSVLWVTSRGLWRRSAAVAPEVVLPRRHGFGGQFRVRELYRRWVEIEDAVRLHRLELSGPDRRRLGRLQRAFGATIPDLGGGGSYS